MRAMDVGVEAAASPQCMVPLQARLELVNAIGQLNVSLSCRRTDSTCLMSALANLGQSCCYQQQVNALCIAMET